MQVPVPRCRCAESEVRRIARGTPLRAPVRPTLSYAIRALLIGLALAAAGPAFAQSQARLIVKLNEAAAKSTATAKTRTEKLARVAGIPLRHVREMAIGADVVVADVASEAEAERVAARLAADPDVAFAQVDHRVHALQAQPPVNDLFAPQQRYLDNGATSIGAYAAWEVTHGSPSVVVAVVDSGYRPHAAMAGRILPGYDMISIPRTANDGDGRDPDASDPGDWVSADEATSDCPAHNSVWHGTSVAGIVGANTNDGGWTAGIDWNAKILPVRVLGKCGGYDSDVLDGIAWAAGLDVPGVPRNPTPAQVINLSLGASSSCPTGYAVVAQAAYAVGVTRAIVAAAGNDSQDVANQSPANCPGYLAIASTTGTSGKLANFSNYGAGITLSAPGGAANFRTPADSVLLLSNAGYTTPAADNVASEGGTSFSAPMVSGTIALMLAVAPWLSPDQVHAILVGSAKPFPSTSDCTTDRCGAGILDAGAAVRAALTAPPQAINYEGLWWNAPADSESGWGVNLAHQGDIIFATWFTYDATGKAWWLSMTANRTAAGVFTGTVFQTHGPPFGAVPFDPHAVTRTAVGEATLTFADGANGTFRYTVNGITQTKAITREVFGPLPTCTFGALANPATATNYQDLWWASPPASESGWGVNLTHQGDTMFATWFTYDVDGSPLWLSVTATRSAPSTYTGTLYRTTGPPFNAVPFDSARVTRTSVGAATFTFADGDSGTFAYTVNGVSQAKAITRQVFVAPGTACQ
ncbi:MAG: S8 family peptidase [Rudaea sp.]